MTMNKISSPTTFAYKKLLPVVFISGLVFGAGMMIWAGGAQLDDLWVFVLALGAGFAFAVVLYRKFFSGLADQVHDLGDALLVRRGDEEERIALTNIMNVSITTMVNPPRITLRLIKSSRFGDEIAFLPRSKLVFFPLAKNAVAEDLILRVHAARTRAQR